MPAPTFVSLPWALGMMMVFSPRGMAREQMAQTANDLMEVAPEVYPPDQVLREDMLSVLTSLTAALGLVMTNGIPLRDRFDIFESEGLNEFREFDRVIKFLKSVDRHDEAESKVE